MIDILRDYDKYKRYLTWIAFAVVLIVFLVFMKKILSFGLNCFLSFLDVLAGVSGVECIKGWVESLKVAWQHVTGLRSQYFPEVEQRSVQAQSAVAAAALVTGFVGSFGSGKLCTRVLTAAKIIVPIVAGAKIASDGLGFVVAQLPVLW